MASKSAQISALVAQLKAGQISKLELFERLQRLQSGGGDAVRVPSERARGQALPPEAPRAPLTPSPPPPPYTSIWKQSAAAPAPAQLAV